MRTLIIAITIVSSLVLFWLVYEKRSTDGAGALWMFLYGLFFQMCLLLLIFTIGALRRNAPGSQGLLLGARDSFIVVVVFWILAVITLNLIR